MWYVFAFSLHVTFSSHDCIYRTWRENCKINTSIICKRKTICKHDNDIYILLHYLAAMECVLQGMCIIGQYVNFIHIICQCSGHMEWCAGRFLVWGVHLIQEWLIVIFFSILWVERDPRSLHSAHRTCETMHIMCFIGQAGMSPPSRASGAISAMLSILGEQERAHWLECHTL